MKKICTVLLILSLLLCGCQNKNNKFDTSIENSAFKQWFDQLPEGEYEHPKSSFYDWYCGSFEDYLGKVTHAVRATYVTTRQDSEEYLHEFKVVECMKGDYNDSLLYLYTRPAWYDNHDNYTNVVEYEVGVDYLLLLSAFEPQFTPIVIFKTPYVHIYIPYDEIGNVDTANWEMCNLDLFSVMEDEELIAAARNGEFIGAVLDRIPDSLDYNFEFAKSNDYENILKESQYVLTVQIKKYLVKHLYWALKPYNATFYLCDVVEIIGGEYTGNAQEVRIALPYMDINCERIDYAIGEEIIITAQDSDLSSTVDLEISNINGIFDVSDSEQIKALLQY